VPSSCWTYMGCLSPSLRLSSPLVGISQSPVTTVMSDHPRCRASLHQVVPTGMTCLELLCDNKFQRNKLTALDIHTTYLLTYLRSVHHSLHCSLHSAFSSRWPYIFTSTFPIIQSSVFWRGHPTDLLLDIRPSIISLSNGSQPTPHHVKIINF